MHWSRLALALWIFAALLLPAGAMGDGEGRAEQAHYIAPPAQGNAGYAATLSARHCWDSLSRPLTEQPPFSEFNGACFRLDGSERFVTITARDDLMPEPQLRIGFGWGASFWYSDLLDEHYLCGSGTVPIPTPEWIGVPPDWMHVIVGQATDDDYALGANGNWPGDPTTYLADCEALGQATQGTLSVTFS